MKKISAENTPGGREGRISIPPERVDKILNIASYFILLLWFYYTVYSYYVLPPVIPTHFGISGNPNAYGSKQSLLLIAVTGVVLFTLLSVLLRYPHSYNYPVKITESNRLYQYRLAQRLLRLLRIVILLVFGTVELLTLETVRGIKQGVALYMLYGLLAMVFGIIIAYLVQANKRGNTHA